MAGLTRRLSSLGYYLQKIYWKIVTAKPSLLLIAAIAVAVSIFFLGGGLYDLFERPLIAAFAAGGRIIFYYPYGINEQFVAESMFVMIIYAIAVVGLLLAYESTRSCCYWLDVLSSLWHMSLSSFFCVRVEGLNADLMARSFPSFNHASACLTVGWKRIRLEGPFLCVA